MMSPFNRKRSPDRDVRRVIFRGIDMASYLDPRLVCTQNLTGKEFHVFESYHEEADSFLRWI
jgi:hypothetical protein